MGTEVEQRPSSSVPALVNTPAFDVGAEDVALSRIYVGQSMSQHVQDGLASFGSLYTALDTDDPEPVVLWSPDGGEEPVRFHVLGMRRGKSTVVDGELLRFDFDDPEAPADCWTTYNYVVALPAVDTEVPFKWLLTRSAQPTARRINSVIVKNGEKTPLHALAFDATTIKRSNRKGTYAVPQARFVEANEEDVEVAAKLASLIPTEAVDVPDTNDEPEI